MGFWSDLAAAVNPLSSPKKKRRPSTVDTGAVSNSITDAGGLGRLPMPGVTVGLGGKNAPLPSLDGPRAAENLSAEQKMMTQATRSPNALQQTVAALGLVPAGGGYDMSGSLIPGAAQQTIPGASPRSGSSVGSARDALEQYLQQAIAAVGPAPDMAGYVRPFDEAAQRAREAYAASTPVINQLADQLKTNLAGSRAEQAAQSQQSLADLRAANAALLGKNQAANSQVLADIAAQGGQIQQGAPMAAAQAMAQALQSGLQSQGANYERSAQQLAQARDASVADRINGAEAGRTNSLANAQANLDNVLNQLGIQRAGAERQFAGDMADYNRQIANTRLDAAKQRLDQAKLDHQTETQLDKQYAQAKAAASETAGESWQQNDMPQLVSQYPKTYAAFQDILKQAGSSKGPVALALASNALSAMQSDPKKFQSVFGFTPDQGTYDMLAQWLKSYYDQTPSMNMQRLAQELSKRQLDPSLVDEYGN